MTIENISNIIDAKIVNSPKVSKVSAATSFASKVELGELFFAVEKKDIKKAIENGAYAIVYEGELESFEDDEVAYLQVDSIEEAAAKFLRYVMSKKESSIYYFNEIEASLLKQITLRKNKIFTILPDNWQKAFESILNSEYEIFISSNKEFVQTLTPNFQELEEKVSGYIISDSLLKTTFKLEKYIYQDMDMPPFYLEDLKRVVAFLKKLEFEYNINNISYTKLFRPYFVDRLLNISKSSQNVLIFTTSLDIINKSIEYLKHQGKWTKSIVLTPPKTKVDIVDRPFWYKSIEEAKEILKKEHFNFAFCYQLNPADIINKDELTKALF